MVSILPASPSRNWRTRVNQTDIRPRDIERGRDIRAITGKVDALLEQTNANEDRIDDIEHTIDPRREKR